MVGTGFLSLLATLDDAETIKDGETGFLIPDGAPKSEWVNKLTLLHKDKKLRKQMGENLRQIVNERFNINNHVRERYHLYKQLMGYKAEAMKKHAEQSNSNS